MTSEVYWVPVITRVYPVIVVEPLILKDVSHFRVLTVEDAYFESEDLHRVEKPYAITQFALEQLLSYSHSERKELLELIDDYAPVLPLRKHEKYSTKYFIPVPRGYPYLFNLLIISKIIRSGRLSCIDYRIVKSNEIYDKLPAVFTLPK